MSCKINRLAGYKVSLDLERDEVGGTHRRAESARRRPGAALLPYRRVTPSRLLRLRRNAGVTVQRLRRNAGVMVQPSRRDTVTRSDDVTADAVTAIRSARFREGYR